MAILTADIDGAAKSCSYLRVELDHEVALLRDLLVAILDLLGDPRTELVANDGVDQVDDPLPRQLGHVSLVWQVLLDLPELAAVLEDRRDAERLVHGYVQVPRVLRLDDYKHVCDDEGYLLFFSPRTISFRK